MVRKSRRGNAEKISHGAKVRDDHAIEFLRYRLLSVDKMLAQPGIDANNRRVLLLMREDIKRLIANG